MRYKLEALASLLPFRVLRRVNRIAPILRDEADGWTFWLGADYRKWCRQDQRKRGPMPQP